MQNKIDDPLNTMNFVVYQYPQTLKSQKKKGKK